MTPPTCPVVDVQQAFRSYRTGESEVPGLIDVNLTVHTGEYLSVMGASASGKSTMPSPADFPRSAPLRAQ